MNSSYIQNTEPLPPIFRFMQTLLVDQTGDFCICLQHLVLMYTSCTIIYTARQKAPSKLNLPRTILNKICTLMTLLYMHNHAKCCFNIQNTDEIMLL